jgi:hypothetical protein
MTAIWAGLLAAIKSIFLKVVSQRFFEWLFFWSVKALVEHTKTPLDDEFYKEAKRVYDEQSERESSS